MVSNLEVNVIPQFVVMECGAFSLFSHLFLALSKHSNLEIEFFNLWISKIFITKHWESVQARFRAISLAGSNPHLIGGYNQPMIIVVKPKIRKIRPSQLDSNTVKVTRSTETKSNVYS